MEKYDLKRSFYAYIGIAVVMIILSLLLLSCKKDKITEEPIKPIPDFEGTYVNYTPKIEEHDTIIITSDYDSIFDRIEYNMTEFNTVRSNGIENIMIKDNYHTSARLDWNNSSVVIKGDIYFYLDYLYLDYLTYIGNNPYKYFKSYYYKI